MIATALLVLLQAATSPLPRPPADWSGLPVLRYLVAPDERVDLSAYVRDEVKAGRCAHAVAAANQWSLTVDVAVLAAPDGSPRRIIPRAIGCPSVEQYAAGLVSRRARRNIDTAGAAAETWYKTSVRFAWPA